MPKVEVILHSKHPEPKLADLRDSVPRSRFLDWIKNRFKPSKYQEIDFDKLNSIQNQNDDIIHNIIMEKPYNCRYSD